MIFMISCVRKSISVDICLLLSIFCVFDCLFRLKAFLHHHSNDSPTYYEQIDFEKPLVLFIIIVSEICVTRVNNLCRVTVLFWSVGIEIS